MPIRPWHLFRRAVADPVSDAALLARFAEQRDPAAFELLVWRHGAMVLAVCRRVLRNDHDAEDAFQAAFLVLAQKAGTVRGESLAGWLHRVARRVAVRAAKRPRPDSLSLDPPDRGAPDAELQAALDAEIDRLPDRLRVPVVLCYLDGRSTENAAKLLGVPRGTVLSRLATARKKLAERLTRKGITAGLFATAVVNETVTANAVEACTAAALRFAAGLGGTTVSIQLAEGVLRMGTRLKSAGWALALVAVAGLGTGVGVVSGNTPQGTSEGKKPDAAAVEQAKPGPVDPPKAQDDDRLEKFRRAQEAEERQRREIARHERMARLESQAQKLQERIAKHTDHLYQLHREVASNVDMKVLQAALAKTDEGILRVEDLAATCASDLDQAREALLRVEKAEPQPQDVEQWVLGVPAVQAASIELHRASQTVENLRKNSPVDSPLVVQAVKVEKEKADLLASARLAAKPAAVKEWREVRRKVQEEAVAAAKGHLDAAQKDLRASNIKRRHLAERYAEAKSLADRIQLVEDELKVYREVRQLVIRQRLLMDIGLEDVR